MTIQPQPGILDIALYQGGASKIEGVEAPLKLSSNENPLGPSQKAIEAAQSALSVLHLYPSTNHASLRQAISEVHGIAVDQIICGAGSDELIAFLCQAYAGPGDEVLYTEHGFAMYRISALAAGATPVVAAEDNRVTDVDALLAACTPATRLVFIANPNNPTGTMIGLSELARLADGLPENALLVLDGAYAEYTDDYDGGIALIKARSNVVMTRTFSKLYGLGGLRVGWAYGPQAIIDVLNRVRGPFNLGAPQLAAAEAAMRDQAYAAHCVAENTRLRSWLRRELANLDVPSDPSFANFILAQFSDADEAVAADAFLKSQGLIVRMVGGYGLPHCLRITIGDEIGCQRIAQAIAAFKKDPQ